MTPNFKRIVNYTDAELAQAIEEAVAHLKPKGIDFYVVLKGVDAYMERRKRKNAEEQRNREIFDYGRGPK